MGSRHCGVWMCDRSHSLLAGGDGEGGGEREREGEAEAEGEGEGEVGCKEGKGAAAGIESLEARLIWSSSDRVSRLGVLSGSDNSISLCGKLGSCVGSRKQEE